MSVRVSTQVSELIICIPVGNDFSNYSTVFCGGPFDFDLSDYYFPMLLRSSELFHTFQSPPSLFHTFVELLNRGMLNILRVYLSKIHWNWVVPNRKWLEMVGSAPPTGARGNTCKEMRWKQAGLGVSIG